MSTLGKNFQESETYWHNKAHVFSSFYSSLNPMHIFTRKFLEDRQKIVARYLIDNPDALALDVGCGSGELVAVLAKKYQFVEGVDYSDIMVGRARKQVHADNVNFVKSDCTLLPYEDARFDSVFALGLFDYVQNMEAALNEICRVTKPSGRLILTFPKSPSLFMPLRIFTGLRNSLFSLPPIVNTVSAKRLQLLAESNGLKIVEKHSLWTTMWIVLLEKVNN